jgi:hypothetical protein
MKLLKELSTDTRQAHAQCVTQESNLHTNCSCEINRQSTVEQQGEMVPIPQLSAGEALSSGRSQDQAVAHVP